jgi:hypothetical protein
VGLASAALPVLSVVLTLLRWDDPLGDAATRYHLVRAAGPGLAGLADAAGTASFGGYPVDAVATLPLMWMREAWPAVSATMWCSLAGVTTAWLVGAWWGNAYAGVAAGCLWEFVVSGTHTIGDVGSACGLALLPLAWGLCLRTLERGVGAASLAGAVAGLLLAVSASAATALLLLCAVTVGVTLRAPEGWRAAPRLVGAFAVGTVVALPALALRSGEPATVHLVSVPLVVVAAAALVVLRRDAARAVVPVLAVLAGLGPVAGEPAAALGLVLLAAGAVPRLVQVGVAEVERREAASAKT